MKNCDRVGIKGLRQRQLSMFKKGGKIDIYFIIDILISILVM